MSFFQDSQGILARDLWLICGKKAQEAVVIHSDWQLVPTAFEGVIEWVYVRRSNRPRDWTRSHSVLYQNPGDYADLNCFYPLVVRIQGFIKTCNLAPLGNWNGEKESAVRAKQHISLCSHGQSEPWVPVLEGLRNIRQLVHNSLTRGVSRRVEPEASRDDDIYVSRRVFSKVRNGDLASHGATLAPMDDPEGWYSRVTSEWRVVDKLVLSRAQPDGVDVPCNWLVFGPGDFVDIAASFDVCFRAQQGVNINLNIQQVVQVAARCTGDTSLTQSHSASFEELDEFANHEVIRTGFASDGEDPMMRSF